jgi:hypothetical protein
MKLPKPGALRIRPTNRFTGTKLLLARCAENGYADDDWRLGQNIPGNCAQTDCVH